MMKFGMRVRTSDSLAQAKFCKTRFGQIYTKKLPISGILGL